jgi:ribonuclease BN (tRNA processing enzyme)
MRAEYNPIFALKNMGSTITVNEIGSSPVEFGPFTMKTILLPHKGTASLGFRISDGKRDVAFLGDLEYTDGSIPDDIVAFASGADLLIHDAGELDLASVDSHLALQLAERTGVKRLLFTHFAPWHTDKDVARLIAAVKKRAPSTLGVEAAHQGLRVTV